MKYVKQNGIWVPSRSARNRQRGFITCGPAFFGSAGSAPSGPAVWDAVKTPSNITRTSDTLVTCNSTSSQYSTCGATIGHASGKWLFQTNGSNNDYFSGIGAATTGSPWINGGYLGAASSNGSSIGFENYNGEIWWNDGVSNTHGNTATASGVAANAWLTVAVDLDNFTFKVFNGNTLLNSLSIPSVLQGLVFYPACSLLAVGDTCQLNAGQTTITIPTPIAGQGYTASW